MEYTVTGIITREETRRNMPARTCDKQEWGNPGIARASPLLLQEADAEAQDVVPLGWFAEWKPEELDETLLWERSEDFGKEWI